MKQTEIQWTDFTVNFWEGCQKVGPGCDHCYAEARDVRFTGGTHWGPGAPRRKVKGGIAKLRKINREAEAFRAEHGRWPRVFCSSLSDVFDNAVDPDWRMEAFAALTVAPNVRAQMLTKRIGNVEKMIPATWRDGWPHWVGLMITVVNQEEADRDIPKLLDLKTRLGIPWVGLSMEPLLGPVDLTSICTGWHFIHSLEGFKWHDTDRAQNSEKCASLDWVIVGGESGRKARPMNPQWARSLRDQCQAAGVSFFFKQWGEYADTETMGIDDTPQLKALHDIKMKGEIKKVHTFDDNAQMYRLGKKAAGRLLDGREWNETPNL